MMNIIFVLRNERHRDPEPTPLHRHHCNGCCEPSLKGIPMKLKKSIALVTGASSGIGKATAERLTAAGYTVYGTSRRGAQASQHSFAMVSLDVTRDESVEAAVSEVIRLEGCVDLLVNNAGFGVA